MAKPRVRPNQLFSYIGKIAVHWNDLEVHLRRLLHSLSEDWFTAAVFSADLQVANLIQVIKTFAAEYDADATKMNRFILAASEKTGRYVRPRDLVSEHVNRVCDCADRLRLYRNAYVHCITSPTKDVPRYTFGGMTVRKGRRLEEYDLPLIPADIRNLATLIRRTILYAQRVEKCIKDNEDTKIHSPPKWPEKLPVRPAELIKPLKSLSDRFPLF
jgi:hypothetical protein